MNRRHALRVLLATAAFLLGAAISLAQSSAGAIKAARVTGSVIKISASGAESQLRDGEALLETDTVRTSGNASVVIIFANGSSVHLGETSRLAIVEFKMDPLDEDIAVAALTNEPSVSRTRLELSYGEMVGNVKTLNSASQYEVRTPVGAAGIRGTTYRIKLNFLPGGQVNFVLSTQEGSVVFESTIQVVGGETLDAAKGVAVNDGKEITAVATTDTGGNVTAVQVSAVTTISPVAQQAIETIVTQAITTAQATTTFTNTEQQQSASSTPPAEQKPATSTPQQSQQEQQADKPKTETKDTTTTPTQTPGQNPLNPQDRSGT